MNEPDNPIDRRGDVRRRVERLTYEVLRRSGDLEPTPPEEVARLEARLREAADSIPESLLTPPDIVSLARLRDVDGTHRRPRWARVGAAIHPLAVRWRPIVAGAAAAAAALVLLFPPPREGETSRGVGGPGEAAAPVGTTDWLSALSTFRFWVAGVLAVLAIAMLLSRRYRRFLPWLLTAVGVGALAGYGFRGESSGSSAPPPVGFKMTSQGTTYALFVAVSKFEGTGFHDLPQAVPTARLLTDCLVEETGVDAGNVIQLVDKEATRAAVRRALYQILQVADSNSQLVLYLGTHADYDVTRAGPMPYLLLSDTRTGDYFETALGFQELVGMIQSLGRARRILVIVDACHAGEIDRRYYDYLQGDFLNSLDRVAVVMASRAGEQALDSADLNASFFGYSLREALRGRADGNRDGSVTLDELGAFLATDVPERTKGRQHPVVRRRATGPWTRLPLVSLPGPSTPQGAAALRNGFGTLRLLVPESALQIAIDGRWYRAGPSTEILLHDIPVGRHVSEVELSDGRRLDTLVDVEEGRPATIDFVALALALSTPVVVFGEAASETTAFFRPVAFEEGSPVLLREDARDAPRSGASCAEVRIDLAKRPWGGMAWLPKGEWGTSPGLDVASALAPQPQERIVLEFFARGATGAEQIEAKVGGIKKGTYHDSMPFPATTRYIRLETSWKRYQIELAGDLSHVVGAFVVVADRAHNGGAGEVVFWLDDVRFTKVSP